MLREYSKRSGVLVVTSNVKCTDTACGVRCEGCEGFQPVSSYESGKIDLNRRTLIERICRGAILKQPQNEVGVPSLRGEMQGRIAACQRTTDVSASIPGACRRIQKLTVGHRPHIRLMLVEKLAKLVISSLLARRRSSRVCKCMLYFSISNAMPRGHTITHLSSMHGAGACSRHAMAARCIGVTPSAPSMNEFKLRSIYCAVRACVCVLVCGMCVCGGTGCTAPNCVRVCAQVQ